MTRFYNLPEITQRVITGVLGAAIILTSLLWSEWTYFWVFFCICGISMVEFYRLLGVDGHFPLKTFGTANGLFIFTMTFLVERGSVVDDYYLLVFITVSTGYLIILYEQRSLKPFLNIAVTFLGILYIAVPFALLNMSIYYDNQYHPEIILGAILMLWASDTGAYFAGRNFGRRKLFERISPKKTWEGSIGGGIFSLSLAFLYAQYNPTLTLLQWMCISAIIVVGGTYGDLVESLFKRSLKIKDSGRVIPGHGGFLDRFDGLLIASPFIVAFVRLL